jgi:hypothetical protein
VNVGPQRAFHLTARKQTTTVAQPLMLPPLPIGRHCILVTIVENEHDPIVAAAPHHAFATVFVVIVGSSSKDYCQAQRVQSKLRSPRIVIAGTGCQNPGISIHPNEMYLQRHVTPGTRVWFVVPICATRSTVAFVHDGALVPATSSPTFRPLTITHTREGEIQLASALLPSGGWDLVVANDDGSTPRAQISKGVYAGP